MYIPVLGVNCSLLGCRFLFAFCNDVNVKLIEAIAVLPSIYDNFIDGCHINDINVDLKKSKAIYQVILSL